MGIIRSDRSAPAKPPLSTAAAPAPPAGQGAAGAPASATATAAGEMVPARRPSVELLRRRDALAEQVAELHWDLGGLAYEMAIRDHFRLDVLVRRAAVLQERDAELAEVERMLAMEEAGAAGHCPVCRAPHSRGAVYCWQCGNTLMQRLPSDAVGDSEQATQIMDALLDTGGLRDSGGGAGAGNSSERGE